MTEQLESTEPAAATAPVPEIGTAEETVPPADGRRAANRGTRAALILAAAFGAYGFVALWAFWPVWPGDPHRIAGAGGDPWEHVWYLQWTSFAVLHGHNPWLTNYLEYPRGVNLGQNTSMPLLGLLGLPLTVAFGPISTLNFMMWLSFPVSATACFALLRRWVDWPWAAFVGGLLYGFSPYMVAAAGGHLQLIFVPFPPLVLLLLDELLIRQRRRVLLMGILLGLVLALEFLVSSEVFGSTIVMAVIGVAVLAVSRPHEVLPRARHALGGLVAGAAVCGVVIAYPAWVQIAGPGVFSGPAQHGSFQADVLATAIPTKLQLLAPHRLAAISATFSAGDVSENGSYLGIPLLLASLGILIWRWRMPLVRFAAAMAIIATVISWGPWLELKGVDHPHVPLPAALIVHLPLFDQFLYARFSLYADLFVAVLLAVGIDQWRGAWQPVGARRAGDRRAGRPVARWRPAALAGALVVLLLPIVPVWPFAPYSPEGPAFFTSSAVGRIPAGSVVLTYPYASNLSPHAMLWQATSGMRFKLMGGYALVRAADGTSTWDPFPPAHQAVPATLTSDYTGEPLASVLPGATTATPAQVRRFLRDYGVGTVVLQPIGAQPALAVSLIEAAIGRPVERGGLDVWFSVQSRLRH